VVTKSATPASAEAIVYHRRIIVYAAISDENPAGERITSYIPGARAAELVSTGQATIRDRSKKRGVVWTIQLSGDAVKLSALDLKPGSFGIKREHTEYGVVFAHKRAWDELR
jgi:hypothetical protein